MAMSKEKFLFFFPVIIWLIIVGFYFNRTPYFQRTHDIDGHIEHTRIIAKEHRLAKPHEGWETYHPPLYFFINSFIATNSLLNERTLHANTVRLMSIAYGGIALLLIAWILSNIGVDFISRALILLFIGTTPKFVFVFTTYNNDSLANLLCLVILILSYLLYKKWSWKLAVGLILATTAGLYAKLTTTFCVLIIILIGATGILKQKKINTIEIRLIVIMFLSLLLLTPWLYFHNYKHVGRFFPSTFQGHLKQDLNIINVGQDVIRYITTLPIISDNKQTWQDPWSHPGWDLTNPATKARNYWDFNFVTSVIGEYFFEKPGVMIIWIMLLFQLLVHLLAIFSINISNLTRLSFAVIFLGHLIHIIWISTWRYPPMPATMDYRYICYLNALWAILYSNILLNKNTLAFFLRRIFLLGIIVQIYFLMTVTGTTPV